MGSACRLSTNVTRLSKSISKHSLRSFLHCAECVFLAPSDSAKFIAFWCKKNRRATEKGDVAILSATPTSTNQNIWIAEMKKVLPQYPSINLVTVAYGDDLSDKSYREAVGLLKSYPDLKVIVSPSSVGIVAAAQAVKDQGKIGKVYVTGLGLPSEMAGAVKSGASKSFAIWNPIDLGYAATYLADDLVKGTASKTEANMGKLGKVQLDADGNGAMAKPFVFDASNIDKFSKIF
ncbi:TPA: substrate-binding domain-containing protein [Citrobacter farmeri]